MPTPRHFPLGLWQADFKRCELVFAITLRLPRETGLETVPGVHALWLRSTVEERDRAGLTLLEPRREFLLTASTTPPGWDLLPGDLLLTDDGNWTVVSATLRPRVGLWHCVCHLSSHSAP